MEERGNRRLDSWKAIAAYLGRDIRTVIRWEKEKGLPVRRVPGGKRQMVYAYEQEMEAWLGKSSAENGAVETREPEQAATPETTAPETARTAGGRWTWTAWRWAGGGLILALGLLAAGLWWLWPPPASGLTLAQSGQNLLARNTKGKTIWSVRLAAPFTLKEVYPWRAGSRHHLLVAINSAPRPNQSGYMRSQLYDFRARDGKLLWQFTPQPQLRFRAGTYNPPWQFQGRAIAYRASGKKWIAWAVNHHTWWPGLLYVLDRRGRARSLFVNSGWIEEVQVYRSARRKELLALGISNSGDAGMLAVLPASGFQASSPETAGSPYQCLNCPAGRPLHYFLFPRSRLNRVTNEYFNLPGANITATGIEVQTHEGYAKKIDATAIYHFDRRWRLLSARFSDSYWNWRHQLRLQGLVKRRRAQSPERRGPAYVLSWTPRQGWRKLYPEHQR